LARQAFGQICGRSQAIVYLFCTQQHLPVLQQFERAYLQKQPCLLQFSPQGLTCKQAQDVSTRPVFTYHNDKDWLYQENIGLRKTAYLIGGGHVSLALTKILVLLEFDVVVIDQRKDVKTMQENHLATQKRILPYSGIRDAIQEGEQSFLLVMTHSHETDQQVIANLAGIQVGYFGMLGSRHCQLYLVKLDVGCIVAPRISHLIAQGHTMHPTGLISFSHPMQLNAALLQPVGSVY
jgi:xanthine dehydrogenase accessory factor